MFSPGVSNDTLELNGTSCTDTSMQKLPTLTTHFGSRAAKTGLGFCCCKIHLLPLQSHCSSIKFTDASMLKVVRLFSMVIGFLISHLGPGCNDRSSIPQTPRRSLCKGDHGDGFFNCMMVSWIGKARMGTAPHSPTFSALPAL